LSQPQTVRATSCQLHGDKLDDIIILKYFLGAPCPLTDSFYFYDEYYWISNHLHRNTEMKLLRRIPSFLRNKFILATVAFIIWMLFFDRNDVFTQAQRRSELNQLKESKQYFEKQIAENKKFSNDLQFNASAIEKYAREKYLMKRDNEDLFIIQPLEKK
jgi:cell division protein DivIC